eukprot:4480200-Prymnesium_polylepis.1
MATHALSCPRMVCVSAEHAPITRKPLQLTKKAAPSHRVRSGRTGSHRVRSGHTGSHRVRSGQIGSDGVRSGSDR